MVVTLPDPSDNRLPGLKPSATRRNGCLGETPEGRCGDDARRGRRPSYPPAWGAGVRLGGWRPWHGRPRTRDVLCVLAIGVSALYAVAAIPLTPALIASHPVLLELLTGSTSSVISAGAYSTVDTKLQLALVIVAALPGIMRFDWVYWWAGRLWGHRIVERLGQRSPRMARLADLAETKGRRWAGPLVALAAFLPGGASVAVYAAAGWTGLPLLAFVLWDTLGSAAWISVVALGGYLLGSDGVTLAILASRYATVTIIVLVAMLVAPQAWPSWREWPVGKATE